LPINININKYRDLRYNFFKWRYELNLLNKMMLAIFFACLTGLFAQIRFFIPGIPVPVTGQVFGVFLAGILLGTWGGFSQIMYLGIGAAGLPWFAGYGGGLSYILGPTGGYLVGFILAAFFIGYAIDRYVKSRRLLPMFLLMLFSTFILIYLPGLIYFYIWSGGIFGLGELIMMCVIPFIAADFIKAIIAVLIATGVTPKIAYGQEVDF
jgi:biotin transport system substrate-specific component